MYSFYLSKKQYYKLLSTNELQLPLLSEPEWKPNDTILFGYVDGSYTSPNGSFLPSIVKTIVIKNTDYLCIYYLVFVVIKRFNDR